MMVQIFIACSLLLVTSHAKTSQEPKRVGLCIGVDQLCGPGLECYRGYCVRSNKISLDNSRTRRKRDTGLKCSSGHQASSICFAPSSCGPYGNYMGSPGCCGDPSYHCESSPYGNICCQNTGPSLVTVTPTPTVPVIPCVGPYCGVTTLSPLGQSRCPNTHIEIGTCNPNNYVYCSGECINGACCRRREGTITTAEDDCIPHYVPQFGQTILLCPEGKMCRENKCVLAICQPTVCPAGKKKIGLCHFSAVNHQVCSATGATCHDGVCCEQINTVQPLPQPQPPQVVQPISPNSICAPTLPTYCANPYNFMMNGCCRKKRK